MYGQGTCYFVKHKLRSHTKSTTLIRYSGYETEVTIYYGTLCNTASPRNRRVSSVETFLLPDTFTRIYTSPYKASPSSPHSSSHLRFFTFLLPILLLFPALCGGLEEA